MIWDMFLMQSQHAQTAQERGAWAERRAASYLKRRGWRLCAQNWIGGGGELDLVLSRWKTLLIVEVRYRADGQPFASIDEQKQVHIQSATKALIKQHQLQQYQLRYDAIGVFPNGKIEHRSFIF